MANGHRAGSVPKQDVPVGGPYRVHRGHRHLHLAERVLGVKALDAHALCRQRVEQVKRVGVHERPGIGAVPRAEMAGAKRTVDLDLADEPLELIGHLDRIAVFGGPRDHALDEATLAPGRDAAVLEILVERDPSPLGGGSHLHERVEVGDHAHVAARSTEDIGRCEVVIGQGSRPAEGEPDTGRCQACELVQRHGLEAVDRSSVDQGPADVPHPRFAEVVDDDRRTGLGINDSRHGLPLSIVRQFPIVSCALAVEA